jgi:hypothetical protein
MTSSLDALQLDEAAAQFAQQIFELADPMARKLRLTGAQQAQGAAIFAGMMARHYAKPGEHEIVGEMAAKIVLGLTRGGTIN